jgi:Trm5-related predicted tRNA methylase
VASQINTAYGWYATLAMVLHGRVSNTTFAAGGVVVGSSFRIRHHSRPLEMHLTYLKGRVKEAVERNTGSSQWQLTKHEESFIDAFHEQKDKIVYLSPDSPNVLETLNPEHIYIIGGIADVHIQKVPRLTLIRNTFLV